MDRQLGRMSLFLLAVVTAAAPAASTIPALISVSDQAGNLNNVGPLRERCGRYTATGGCGFGHFNDDGTVGGDALTKTCDPCHAQAEDGDTVSLITLLDCEPQRRE